MGPKSADPRCSVMLRFARCKVSSLAIHSRWHPQPPHRSIHLTTKTKGGLSIHPSSHPALHSTGTNSVAAQTDTDCATARARRGRRCCVRQSNPIHPSEECARGRPSTDRDRGRSGFFFHQDWELGGPADGRTDRAGG